MSIGSWIITFVLLAIPLVNLIMLFIWAFDAMSERRKLCARIFNYSWNRVGVMDSHFHSDANSGSIIRAFLEL